MFTYILKIIIFFFTLLFFISCQSFQEYCKEDIKSMYVGASSEDEYYECINKSNRPWKTSGKDFISLLSVPYKP